MFNKYLIIRWMGRWMNERKMKYLFNNICGEHIMCYRDLNMEKTFLQWKDQRECSPCVEACGMGKILQVDMREMPAKCKIGMSTE